MDERQSVVAAPGGLTVEQAKILIDAEIAVGARMLKEGKPLPAALRARCESVISGTPAGATYVQNQVELGSLLGVTRKTIQRWLKVEGNPGAQADGRYNVSAWRTWAAQQGKDLDGESASSAIVVQKARRLLLQNADLEFRLKVKRAEYLPRSVARQAFAMFIGAAKTRSISGASRLALLVRAAKDTTEAIEIIRQEQLDIWRDLEQSEWGNETSQ